MRTPLKLVIFDVDGTLLDSQEHIVSAMTTAFTTLDLPAPTRHEALGIVGLSLPEAMRALAPEASASDQRRLVDAYRRSHTDVRKSSAEPPLFDGARAAIDALDDAGFMLSAATGKSRAGLSRFLTTQGLAHRFFGTQTADDAPSKPHPEMIRLALAANGVDACDAVMIGDTEFDMAMARAAGVAAIGVSWGYHPRHRIRRGGAQWIAEAPSDLPAIVTDALGHS